MDDFFNNNFFWVIWYVEFYKWINKRNLCILFLLVFDVVVLLIDKGEWEECWNGINDEILWGYFELSLDDWIEVVEVFLDEWIIFLDERIIFLDERILDVKVMLRFIL